MTSEHLTGSSTPQLDAHLYGIRNEFDRLNQELDEARKQREEYKSLYWNKEKELRKLITLLFHRQNGKDQICQCCKGGHTAALADDNPSISSASSSSEYYSPLEGKDVVPAPLDNIGNSIEISPIDGDVRLGEAAISVQNEDSTSSLPLGPDIISTKEVGKSRSRWDIEYNGNTEIGLKLDLVHELKQEGITRVAFSPNGKYLATASSVGIVCIFDASTGERISVMRDLYQNPDESVPYSCLGFSPDNNHLATGGWDGKVRIWIISQRRARNIFGLGGYIRDLNFSPNGKHLVTCSFDQIVRIWRLRGGHSRVLTGGLYTPRAVRFSPDGRYIASGYNLGQIMIWNERTTSLVARLEGNGTVSSLSFTPDAKGLLCSSSDKGLILWDVAWLSRSPEITLYNAERQQDVNSTLMEVLCFVGHTDRVYTVSISPDGKWIASASRDMTVRIWDAQDATLQCTLHGPTQVLSIAFSPVGTYLAIGGYSEVPLVTIWNYANLS